MEEFYEKTHMVAEGAVACVTVDELGKREGLELPITQQVRAVLYEAQPVAEAEEALLGREAGDELHGLGLVEE